VPATGDRARRCGRRERPPPRRGRAAARAPAAPAPRARARVVVDRAARGLRPSRRREPADARDRRGARDPDQHRLLALAPCTRRPESRPCAPARSGREGGRMSDPTELPPIDEELAALIAAERARPGPSMADAARLSARVLADIGGGGTGPAGGGPAQR